MADIKPFCSIRPGKGLEANVAALPYDVYNRQEAKEAVKGNPLSFLNIDRAETGLADEVDTYDPKVYERAQQLLTGQIADGTYIQDEKPCYYLYELTMQGRSQTGIVACASVDDYLSGVIMKHENTRAEKEADRIRHVDTLSAQTGPIFLAYRTDDALEQIKQTEKQNMPYADFTSEDGIRHRMWQITDVDRISQIQNCFANMEKIYIADGHHRCASAVKVSLKRREENPGYTGNEEFNYFLSVLFAESELHIMDYNRVVKDLNGLSPEAFLEKVREKFTVHLNGDGTEAVHCDRKGMFGMYLENRWYVLTQIGKKSEDPVKALDVSVLQNDLLAPILNIRDPKTDHRIDFVGGIRGLAELERRCHTDCQAAFCLYPTSMEELFAVADADRLMPPKSTWFEPKLRSGLFIHKI